MEKKKLSLTEIRIGSFITAISESEKQTLAGADGVFVFPYRVSHLRAIPYVPPVNIAILPEA